MVCTLKYIGCHDNISANKTLTEIILRLNRIKLEGKPKFDIPRSCDLDPNFSVRAFIVNVLFYADPL